MDSDDSRITCRALKILICQNVPPYRVICMWQRQEPYLRIDFDGKAKKFKENDEDSSKSDEIVNNNGGLKILQRRESPLGVLYLKNFCLLKEPFSFGYRATQSSNS